MLNIHRVNFIIIAYWRQKYKHIWILLQIRDSDKDARILNM